MQETFQSTLIDPGVMESVKAITAQFTAEELVTQRETVKAKIEDQIKSYVRGALTQRGLPGAIEIGSVAITHFDFSKDFNDSIEAKVKAEQDALRAENEKKQKVTQAEADRDSQKAKADGSAYAIEVQSKAEAAAIQRKADALRANPNLVQLNAVDKWDGKMPQYMGGQTPIPFIGPIPK
jgi:regulator of protease activity HflC (stomatin/prohibitin superfamily)